MSKAEIKYDPKKLKSLSIFPRSKRQPLSTMALSNPLRLVRRALTASEKEARHLIVVANRRLDRLHEVMKESNATIEKLITENIKSGFHLVDEVFIPESLGFIDIPPSKEDDIRVYAKDGYSMTRLEDDWLVITPEDTKVNLKIKNMYEAIIVLGSIGMDITVEGYVKLQYFQENDTLDSIVDKAISSVVESKK